MTESNSRAEPKSWAQDCNQYRSTRGSKSFSTLEDGGKAPERYSRTNYVPFLAERHPLYSYNDLGEDGKGKVRLDPATQADRFSRHGWGDVSLLKQEGLGGQPHPRSSEAGPARTGRLRPGSPRGVDGRNGLYGVLQMTEAGGTDSWVGHPQIDPTKGKRAVAPPPDPKGRRDLFDVLHARSPGMPADDSWLGHQLIDPARGKAHPPGPEQSRGRRDLTELFTMSILQDPRRLELLQKGADKHGDAWCGNILIDPARGKKSVEDVSAAGQNLHGATFKPVPAGTLPDAPRRHTRPAPAPVSDASAAEVIRGEAGGDDWGPRTKRSVPDMPKPNAFDGRTDLYAHMQYRALSSSEQGKYAKAFDDRGTRGRRQLHTPGDADPAKESLLTWKPEMRVGQFVKNGGLAQENRVRGHTLRATAGR
ncbi:hypothetical protein HXX76_015374 [Chlamydomonas incerta]|uniref:Uncharacterized protein n=1 Tax=Chlamydomonas incerta TaxID=51695 RepID=A0A835SJA0_CHLIN|nr:hypothetical protein HXX76_015374 [Chlamydomonas incerta]|eukprot:KAG2423409.1 hypothetical protein HXX76_015374 [Chlamydomonas incerta]